MKPVFDARANAADPAALTAADDDDDDDEEEDR